MGAEGYIGKLKGFYGYSNGHVYAARVSTISDLDKKSLVKNHSLWLSLTEAEDVFRNQSKQSCEGSYEVVCLQTDTVVSEWKGGEKIYELS